MKNIGSYHNLLTELDRKIDQIAELRKKRKQRLFALLAHVEGRFHSSQQELTGARAHIRELEGVIHGLNDRLAHVVSEVAREAQSTDELCARITEIDQALSAIAANPKANASPEPMAFPPIAPEPAREDPVREDLAPPVPPTETPSRNGLREKGGCKAGTARARRGRNAGPRSRTEGRSNQPCRPKPGARRSASRSGPNRIALPADPYEDALRKIEEATQFIYKDV